MHTVYTQQKIQQMFHEEHSWRLASLTRDSSNHYMDTMNLDINIRQETRNFYM